MNRRLIVVLVAGLLGCKGADGAMGPAGPQGATGVAGIQGPVGPAGPGGATGSSLTMSRVAATSDVVFQLPAAVGDATHPPITIGYLSGNPAGGSWVQVSDAFSVDAPFLTFQFTAGAWTVRMKNTPIGFTAIVVVSY